MHLSDVGDLHHVEQRRRRAAARSSRTGSRRPGSPRSRPPARRAARPAARPGHARKRRRRRRAPCATPASLAAASAAAPATLLPATRTSTGRPSCAAAVSARAVRSLKWPFATSASRRVVMVRSLPASSCSLATSSATVLTFTPALRPPGSVGLQHFQARRDVDPESAGVFSSIGFFLAFMMLGSDA